MPVVSRSYVCAVLPPGAGALERALAAQDRPADAAVRARDVSAADPGGWVWFLDGTAVPRPDALAALLAAAERLESVSAPAVLASRVVASDGALAPAHVPLAPQAQTQVAVRTAALRVLPIRAATGGSLLVRGHALSHVGSRDGAAMLWTARLLRQEPGFLVPDSVAEASAAPARGSHSARVAAQLLLGTALRPRERLRFGVELGERITPRPSG